jgi:hypothetical protein
MGRGLLVACLERASGAVGFPDWHSRKWFALFCTLKSLSFSFNAPQTEVSQYAQGIECARTDEVDRQQRNLERVNEHNLTHNKEHGNSTQPKDE